MTLWQDQSSRGTRNGTAVDTAGVEETRDDGQPLSRRAARERERRAAEALAEGRVHPSGVVDFDGHDFGEGFRADQDLTVPDTADIWAALSRRADTPPPADGPHTGDLARFRSGVPEAPARRTGPVPASPVTGELLERVRDAVLREHEAEPLVRTPVQQPPLSRRELRRRQAAQTTEDGMPAAWFSDELPVPAAFAGYDDAPTVAMPALDYAELEAQAPVTTPVDIPRFFAEPVGDDALTFSSPVPFVQPEPLPQVAEADPEFIEPRAPHRGLAWSQVSDDDVEADGAMDLSGYTDVSGYPGHADYAAPPVGYAEPPAAFGPEQVGPPSEVTDLAGFEALIRRARSGQPPVAPAPMFRQPEPQRQALPWADEDDAQDYTGLLGRPVQGSNGSANSLILSTDPQPDLAGAVNSTGDIFITGSLNLSRSIAQTGAPEHYDSLDMDRLFEASQVEPGAGVAPVRASRAVSGTGSTRAIIGARRARGNVLPTVLAIIAGAMAVGVVTLLVGSWVLKLF